MNASKYNVMSWHVQVLMSHGKLQCNFNGSSSPCTISKLSNWYKQIQCYVLTCPSVNFIWETPMLFQWDFISMFKCQFHMGNSNVIPMRLHLHVQVSISYGKLQCYSNETSSPCSSVNFIWETPMSFQWEFISMYNLKTKLKVAKHIEGHQNLVSILWKWDTRTRHHIGGMGHIKSGTPILGFNSLYYKWTFSITNASKYNVMSWHVQVSTSYGKLQCYSNETASPCTISKLSYKLQNILRDTKT